MKTYLLILSFAFSAMIFTNKLFSQQNNMCQNPTKDIDQISTTIKKYSKKVYINWKESNHSYDSYYLIQKSKDGIGYTNVGIKDSYKVDNNIELSFSYVDSLSDASDYYYRVIRVDEHDNGMVASSKSYLIVNGNNSNEVINEMIEYQNTAFIQRK